ncbi:MAG TPA: glycoside hydrolase family 15 protein, partial [Acidimicrobiia bacterium]|nr:glycoside hydrolase family 15 protein [Acidimicrobiia bacterium]
DSGVWEGREGERNYVSSKLMCWVALDRAVKLAPALGVDPAVWAHERDSIRDEILTRGWNEDAGAFTGAFDSDHLDASVLLLPIVGFLPASDPRVEATVAAIERELVENDLVRRWTGAAPEGAFVMCSYWLAQCHALAGRVDRAREIFERVTGFANDVDLLSEMVDPSTQLLIGNFPQTLSHAALINAAATIDQAIETGAA